MYCDILKGVVRTVYAMRRTGSEKTGRNRPRLAGILSGGEKRWNDGQMRRFASYGRMMGGEGQVFDPLEELASTFEFEKSLEVFAQNTCNACAERLREHLDQKRYELWESLPQRFDLPKWKELRESLSGWVPEPEDM
jgi:hypothetical protein